MSADDHVFVAWEEQVISQEKGNRLVHFYLKDSSGDLILAVVGTERSIRHMIYVVSDDFFQSYWSRGCINAGTKWRARREVVDWLTSLVSKPQPPLKSANSQESRESLVSRQFSTLRTQLLDQMIQVPRKLKFPNSDIVWSGDVWICCKQLKHYPAFCRNRTTIAVYSFVFIMTEEENHYVGYVEDLYEDKKGHKKVKVQLFQHNQEVRDVIPQLNPHPREVFITPHVQVISAECIDGPAAVLTPKHYEKCLAVVPQSSLSGIFMCFRQFINNKVKLFSLSKLRGYPNQTILSSLNCPLVSNHSTKDHKPNKEDFTHQDPAKQGGKRNRCCKGHQGIESGHSGVTNSVPGNQLAKCEPTYRKLKIKLSNKGAVGSKLVGLEPQLQASIKVDERIELLCQDSGIRGCWFRCKILKASQKRLKVQYNDVQDVEGTRNLEEWVPASRVAAPDNLGMRCSGRLTIRPWPPENFSDRPLEVGAAVDAWWSHGWWEGVVAGFNTSGCDIVHVYFPGEKRLLTLQRKNIRISRDWVDNRWIDVKAKPEILSSISSTVGSNMKIPMCSTLAKASECDGAVASVDRKVPTTSKVEVDRNKRELPGSAASDDVENVEGLNLKKILGINDDENQVGGVFRSNGDNGVGQVNFRGQF